MIISYTVKTDVKLKSEETTCYIETSHGNPTRSTTKVLGLCSTPQRWMLDNL